MGENNIVINQSTTTSWEMDDCLNEDSCQPLNAPKATSDDSFILIDNDGIANAPQELNESEEPSLTTRSSLPPYIQIIKNTLDYSDDIWSAPYITTTPYFASLLAPTKDSKKIDERHRVVSKVQDNGTVYIKIIHEAALERDYFDNNFKTSPTRDTTAESQSGVKIKEGGWALDRFGERVPNETIMTLIYPDTISSERPQLKIDEFGFLTDKSGYKIDLDGQKISQKRQFLMEYSYRQLTLFPTGDTAITNESLANLTPEDIANMTYVDVDSAYDITSDYRGFQIHEISYQTILLPLLKQDPTSSEDEYTLTQFKMTTSPYSYTISDILAKPDDGWNIQFDNELIASSSDETPSVKIDSIPKTIAEWKELGGNHTVQYDATISFQTYDEKEYDRLISITEEITITDTEITQSKQSTSSKPNADTPLHTIIETKVYSLASNELIRESLELIDKEERLHITKTTQGDDISIKTRTPTLTINQLHAVTGDQTLSSPQIPVTNTYNQRSSFQSTLLWGVGAEMGFGSMSVYGNELPGHYFSPYVYTGLKQPLTQNGPVDFSLNMELYLDGLGSSSYLKANPDLPEGIEGISSQNNFGARTHLSLNIADPSKNLWEVGIGGRAGISNHNANESYLTAGSAVYHAEVISMGTETKLGVFGRAAFLDGSITLYGGQEWVSGNEVKSHYYLNGPSGEAVDLTEYLPTQGQHIFGSVSIQPIKLVKKITK